MGLELSIVGRTSARITMSYDPKTVALYALGVGAKKAELSFLYENAEGGMKVLPTFAVVPAFAPLMALLADSGGDMSMVVHGAQKVRLAGPIPAEATVATVARAEGLYDMKKLAQLVLSTTTHLVEKDGSDGRKLFDTTWSILFRNAGGFGGPRPPQDDAPSVPKDRPAEFELVESTSPEQALLYRLSGDWNPLHADPAFAERVGFAQGPILHGLCTFGYAGRAALLHACGGDPARLVGFGAQFRKPVWPGDTLVTRGWRVDPSGATPEASGGETRWVIDTRVKERDESVLTGAYADVARPA
jgi:acyl dehydratase